MNELKINELLPTAFIGFWGGMVPFLCFDAYRRLMCNNDLERTFLIIGFVASGWLAIAALRNIINRSQPH